VLTSIVLKSNVTMLDIVSTRMLGQFGFLAKVCSAIGPVILIHMSLF
jgi:aspartate kinase